MSNVDKAIEHLNRKISEREHSQTIPFDEYLRILTERPDAVVRNVFQTFHDMIRSYIGVGRDEYPDDTESINYVNYDCSNLFVNDNDRPFFADRLFANRLINHVDEMKGSARQNKIYIFEGPPGSGKSTFLNNLLLKFEEYANSEAGTRYEVVWKLDRQQMASFAPQEVNQFLDKLTNLLDEYELEQGQVLEAKNHLIAGEYVEVSCPSHDNPLLI